MSSPENLPGKSHREGEDVKGKIKADIKAERQRKEAEEREAREREKLAKMGRKLQEITGSESPEAREERENLDYFRMQDM
jgi:hypothetical protein